MKFLLFLIFFSPYVQAATTLPSAMPKCVRPKDFSNGKFVASYEICLKRQETFCGIHKEDKNCLALPKMTGKPYFKTTVDDIDPSQRCKIEKDEAYKCIQDPIRIIPATETTSAPAPAADLAPKNTPITTEGSGENANGETATPQPVVMPPPPPHPH